MEDSIQFFQQDSNFVLANPDAIRTWLTQIASRFEKEILGINYIFCSDEYLLTLNKQYLEHDYYTDILTFPYPSPVANQIHSDIYISIERVQENAADLSVSFLDELHRVMVHGLLHLIGFDDHGDEKVKEMRSQEDQALDQRDF